uniref:Transmembrane protein 120B-like n=1 Tax=Petromyzon marinus TaxID=7757 RepID=A0AAJ7TVZ3_PETMA|nr:transmembrane protein 120B-like [Petromyzon marinus]
MSLKDCASEWTDLEKDYQALKERHRVYMERLAELTSMQSACSSSISRQKRLLKDLNSKLKRCGRGGGASGEEMEKLERIGVGVKEQEVTFEEMEAFLPKKNGLYLRLVLGNVNLTLLSKQAKYAYKDEYETFKLRLTIVCFLMSLTLLLGVNTRVTDAILNFVLVWYYCTLTLRESILINNGSRIKGWWVIHHYVSTFLSGVMLTWPDGEMYQSFRTQFLGFSVYQSVVQFLQYYYQSGCLYRLRALGERRSLDITVEGFQSWMWRGLAFIIPFLFFGHFWQLYNSYTLYHMSLSPQCREWQVHVEALVFFVLFIGNFFTTLKVVSSKMRERYTRHKRT